MFLYQKSILWSLFLSFLIIFFAIIGVSWIVQSIRSLELILSEGVYVGTYFKLTIFTLPFILLIIIPLVTCLSIYSTYKKLLFNREIVAIQSFGISKKRIINIFFFFASVVVVLHLVISFYILPLSVQYVKKVRSNIIQENSLLNLLQPNSFITVLDKVTILIEKREKNNLLKNIFIFDNRNSNKSISFISNSGELTFTQEGGKLDLIDGVQVEFDNEKKAYSLIKFAKNVFFLNNKENNKKTAVKSFDEMGVFELFFSKEIPKDKYLRHKAEARFRLLWPFASLFLTIIVLYFVINDKGERLRARYYELKLFVTVIAFLFFMLGSYILSFDSYLIVLVYLVLCALMILMVSALYFDSKKLK